MSNTKRWWTVFAFAVAMAWVEAAVVFYLRTLVNRIEPYQANPLPLIGTFGPIELAREAATLVMLLMVGIIAGKTWRSRLGYAAIAFGVWDICYYVFLKVMCGWPHSLLNWDILFLLPLPWWGPVLAPMLIAALMILWGTLTSQFEAVVHDPSFTRVGWALCLVGIGLALYVFMADCIMATSRGAEAVRSVLPERFNWPLFSVSLILISVPVVQLFVRVIEQKLKANCSSSKQAENEKLAPIF